MLWQPTLDAPLVHLRPLTPDDWTELSQVASDPLIWALHPEPTRWQPEVFRRFFDGALESQGALAIVDPKSGALIGSSRYTEHREDTRSVEIGYTFLARPYWGGAVNRAVKSLMLTHAFTLVDTVWFVVGKDNLRSRRAMEKIGGVLAPMGEAPVSGKDDTHVFYRITRPA